MNAIPASLTYSKPLMNPLDPKARFLKSPCFQLLSDLSVNDQFHDALTAALATYTLHLGSDAFASTKLLGAKEFINVLLTLPDPIVKLQSKPIPRANLNTIDKYASDLKPTSK